MDNIRRELKAVSKEVLIEFIINESIVYEDNTENAVEELKRKLQIINDSLDEREFNNISKELLIKFIKKEMFRGKLNFKKFKNLLIAFKEKEKAMKKWRDYERHLTDKYDGYSLIDLTPKERLKQKKLEKKFSRSLEIYSKIEKEQKEDE